MKRAMLLIMTLLILAGCQTKIVKHPDAPMLITEVGWCNKVKVAVYDKEFNRLIDYGWVKVPVGWTLHKFDWESRITDNE